MMSSKQHPQSSAAAMASSNNTLTNGSLINFVVSFLAQCASNDVNSIKRVETTKGAKVILLTLNIYNNVINDIQMISIIQNSAIPEFVPILQACSYIL